MAAAVRGHYEAIGAGNFEEAYSYFGPTLRSQTDEANVDRGSGVIPDTEH